MNKNKNIILSIILAVIVALTFLLFFGIGSSQKDGIQISSFIFILIDELLTYGVVMYLSNDKTNTFSIAGFSSITFVYTIFSLFFNTLFRKIFVTVKTILIFNFSILLIYLFLILIVLLFKKEK